MPKACKRPDKRARCRRPFASLTAPELSDLGVLRCFAFSNKIFALIGHLI